MDQSGIRFFESCGYGLLVFARTTWSRREYQRNCETSRSRAQDFQSNRFLSVCQGGMTSPRNVVSAHTNHWIIAMAIAVLIFGALLSRVIEPGVRVEKVMLTTN